MSTTTLNIFSLIQNCKKKFENKKNITDINKSVFGGWYNKQPKLIKDKCISICNYINSSHFSYEDLKDFIHYKYIYNEKLSFMDFKYDDICETKELFSETKLDEDKKFVTEICKRNKIDDVHVLFDINEDGDSYIYNMIFKNYISPIFYMRMIKYCDVDYTKENEEHERFRLIFNALKDEKVQNN